MTPVSADSKRQPAVHVQFLSMPEPLPVSPAIGLGASAFLESGDVLLIAERLAARNMDVITTPFDLPARFGGGLRYAHHPLVRT